MRAAVVTRGALALLAVLAMSAGGACGSSAVEEGQKTWVDRPAAPAKDKLIKPEAEEAAEEEYVNPRFDLLEKHFRRFARRPASAQKDMFKSHLDKYVEKIEIKVAATDGSTEEPPVAEPQEELNPLKKFPADEYRLVAIMTGIGTPAAMVRDPKGHAYTVRTDTEVGNEGGVVEAITQYEVVITNPNDPKPVRLNIRPEMFDISQRQIEEEELQEEVPGELP